MWNSFYIGLIAASMNVLIAALAAYAFSRMEFRGRRALLTSLLVMQIFPQFLGFIAFFVLSQEFGEVWSAIGFNTHAFLILVYIGGAAGFNAFLLKGFLDSVPKSLDEAARIDGAGSLTIFFRIIMPLARPMLAVIFMISFITIFSEFVLASFLLSGTDQLTLPVGLQSFLAEGYNAKWGILAATALFGADTDRGGVRPGAEAHHRWAHGRRRQGLTTVWRSGVAACVIDRARRRRPARGRTTIRATTARPYVAAPPSRADEPDVTSRPSRRLLRRAIRWSTSARWRRPSAVRCPVARSTS